MEEMQLAQTVPAISLKSLVVSMQPGEEKPFPMQKDQSVRSAISSSIKVEYPDREYTTSRVEINGMRVLKVTRLK